ncbi:Cysteine proteinases superfamily protein [Euphorbia peplus]|nr:Cysteine proteinases superfamily protein [Euphorbia peplus]
MLKQNKRLAFSIRQISSSVGFPVRSSSSSPHLGTQWNGVPPGVRCCSILSEFQQTKKEQDNKFQEWALASREEESMLNKFQDWMVEFGRVYEDANEKIKRYLLFKDSVHEVDLFNRTDTMASYGLNSMSDYTEEEYLKTCNWHSEDDEDDI